MKSLPYAIAFLCLLVALYLGYENLQLKKEILSKQERSIELSDKVQEMISNKSDIELLNQNLVESIKSLENNNDDLNSELKAALLDIEVRDKLIESLKEQIIIDDKELKSIKSESQEVDTYSVTNDISADLVKFSEREKHIINRWNQLAEINCDYDFWGVKIGDELLDVVGVTGSTFQCEYEFSHDSIGDEGLLLNRRFMEIGFWGTRVKSMIINYSESGESKYLDMSMDDLVNQLVVDYSECNVFLEDQEIIVMDERNNVEMKYVNFSDELFIFVRYVEQL